MTPQTLLVFAILWTANIALAASPQDLLTAYEAKSAKVEKWFKRNCNDVLGRECDVQEKADVLSWLMIVK
jgi:hypothetical protein